MAGNPSRAGNSPPKKGAGSAREKGKSSQSGQRKSGSSSSGREEPMETSSSRQEAVSLDSSSDFLFITTSKPSNFKDPIVRKEISRHVMKDYTNKQQSGKEPSGGKAKVIPHRQGDKEPGVDPMNTHFPQTSDYMTGAPDIFASGTLDSSVLTQNMIYPLNIDLSSLDIQNRLGHLLPRYMSVWFGAQATRLCGGGTHNAWEKWMPNEVNNNTLLYAQAFAAVTHINFLSPQVYQSERYLLKGQAIQAISKTLPNQETSHVDGNIGAVLCMAVVAPLDYDSQKNFITHMNGLQKMVSIRGGLRALRSNRMLHDALCLCDLSGAIIFRTTPVLVTNQDLDQGGIAENMFDSPLGHCDDPIEPHRRPNLSTDSIQTLNNLWALTQRWITASRSGAKLKDSTPVANRFALIERQLTLNPTHSAAAAQSQMPHQVREACRLAGLIYFRALFHDVPFSSSENLMAMQGLRAALEISILSGWNGAPGLLLWVLLVGTAAARSTSDQTFFAGHLSTTCFCLVAHWHNVQQILATFLQIDRMV